MQLHDTGALFETIQRAALFPDDKTFADAVPRRPLAEIVSAFSAFLHAMHGPPDAGQLRAFVSENFILPDDTPAPKPQAADPAGIAAHLKKLWKTFYREPMLEDDGSTLLPLPEPYIVPGGRFREIYYWDSFFTMLGLRASGDETMIHHMLANFLYLQARHNFIPNGNRSYYLSRSQPPLLPMMVKLISAGQESIMLPRFRNALHAEHNYWMDHSAPTQHVVQLPDGSRLNRYWDQLDTPRPEAFKNDETLAQKISFSPAKLYRDLRSAAESGWDFSSRWLADPARLETIRTTRIVPVDLNCFLWELEHMLARAYAAAGDTAARQHFDELAEARRHAIQKNCWSPEAGFFCDYDLDTRTHSSRLNLAGATPLYFGLATAAQQNACAATLKERFLVAGGFVTTLCESGQQWDWPNGWAPLQWLTIRGLEKTGSRELAADAAHRWIKLNCDVYARTGHMLEKYNVIDAQRAPREGNEYITQQGFGWTNGVLLDLLRDYPL